MTKKLLTLIGTVAMVFASAQTISFETSEGYTVGTLSGQQNWVVWGGVYASDSQVVSGTSTVGTNSMYLESYGDVQDWCGIEKPITAMTSNKYSISFDYKHEGFGGSDYQIDFYNVVGTAYNRVSAISVGYQAGAIRYANMTPTPAFVTSTSSMAEDTWTNLKVVVDKGTSTLEYFVNNVSIGTGGLGTNKDINNIDFTFDDYGTGFYVDNIVMTDLSNLGTKDISTKINSEVSIFPNPATDFIEIKTKENVKSVQIFDASGKLVKKLGNETKVDVRELEKGNYVMSISTSDSVVSKKFIKK